MGAVGVAAVSRPPCRSFVLAGTLGRVRSATFEVRYVTNHGRFDVSTGKVAGRLEMI